MNDLTWLERIQIGGLQRQEFYLALAQTSSDGIKVHDVLQDMATEFTKSRDPMLPVVQHMMDRQRGGRRPNGAKSSSTTVARNLTGLVPETEVILVESGETSKGLDVGFRQAARFIERMGSLRAAVTKPLIEPALLFIGIVLVMILMSYMVLPGYKQLAPREKWPVYSAWYGTLADNVLIVAGVSIGVMVTFLWTWSWLQRNWTGEWRIFADRYIFPFNLAANVEASALLTSLVGFVEAGVQISTALERLAQNATPYMKWVYSLMHHQLSSGVSPAAALKSLHIMPTKIHWRFAVYGRTNNFEYALETIAQNLIDTTIRKTTGIFAWVSLALKLMVAGYVLWTVTALFGITLAAKKAANVQGASLNRGEVHFVMGPMDVHAAPFIVADDIRWRT